MATFTKRGSGKWQAKIRKKGYPEVIKTFETKAKAQRWARSIETEMDQRVFVSRSEAESTTLREALERYLKEITPTKKGAAAEANRIKAWMRHELADHYLSNLRSTDFVQYREESLAMGAKASTVRNNLNIISHLFTLSRKEWGMESLSNPTKNVTRPKLPPGRDRRLRENEEELLLTAPDPLRQIIAIALETAMRLGEIMDLTWDNVNLERATLSLPDSKNGERRVVPLSSNARKCIRSIPQSDSREVFPGLSSPAISKRFALFRKKLGIVDLRFHDLRHEATSRLFEKGLDMMEVATITGHKTLQMLKRYTHLKAEKIAKKLG